LTPGILATNLGNNVWWGKAAHPYRLVILDSCDSFSSGWAAAFGIPAIMNSTESEFAKYGRDPQAFVAWESDTPLPTLTPDIEAWGSCVRDLNAKWMLGFPLYACMNTYVYDLLSYSGTYLPIFLMPSDNPEYDGEFDVDKPYALADFNYYGCVDLSSISDE